MKKRGYSLIEVLVAMAILTIGLLGTLSLLLTEIKYNEANQMRVAAQELLEGYALDFRGMSYNAFSKVNLEKTMGFSESVQSGYPAGGEVLSSCPAGFEDRLYKSDVVVKKINGNVQKYKYTIKLCIDENYLSPYLKRSYLWVFWRYGGKLHKIKTEIFVGQKE